MGREDLLYFDNAATSWPKPTQVLVEMRRAVEEYGGNPGRGTHKLAMKAAETVYQARENLARFFMTETPENFIFTMNTTYALNIAIKGLLRPGDHVLLSNMEHNAVLRPIEHLRAKGEISYDLFDALGSDEEVIRSLDEKTRPNTKMVVCLHASNVCGRVLPVKKIARYCKARNFLFVLDAAQSAGHVPLPIGALGADAVAMPGHKGLLGTAGIGVLYVRPGLLPETMIEGGTGVHSLEKEMPSFLPERLEGGTLPVPGIAGLNAALGWLMKIKMESILEKERYLGGKLAQRLLNDDLLETYALTEGSVFSVNLKGVLPQEFGQKLAEHGVCVRSGFHCAPLAHQCIGSGTNGTVRFSIGCFNTENDIKKLDRILSRVESELVI